MCVNCRYVGIYVVIFVYAYICVTITTGAPCIASGCALSRQLCLGFHPVPASLWFLQRVRPACAVLRVPEKHKNRATTTTTITIIIYAYCIDNVSIIVCAYV